jgi:hypothetical protein
MKISYSDNSLAVQVAKAGTENWEEVYRNDSFSLPDNSHLLLQSHCGSGVTFSNITLSPGDD